MNDLYTPRRVSAYGTGYSAFVRVLKFALPLVALVIVGLLIARLSSDPQQQSMTALPKDEKTTPGQIELAGAKYEGVDDQGRPYTVTADKAVRAMDAPDTVLFENPVADITLLDKTWVAVKAKGGAFDRKTETLALKEGVTVYHDSGYEIHLQDLTIHLKQQTARTDQPVEAQGPLGAIVAANMSVENQAERIVFGGPVRLTFYRLGSGKVRG